APDNWHHLEGVYPKAGVFRLHVYDDYSKPLSGPQLRRVAAEVTTANGVAPLTLVPGADFLEARVPEISWPVSVTAQVAFTPGSPRNRFDFTFTAYSHDALPDVVPGTGPTGDVRPKEEVHLKADTPYKTSGSIDLALAELRDRTRELKEIVDRGAFG